MIEKLKERSGMSYLQGVVVLLVLLAFTAVFMQGLRCYVIVRNVDDSLRVSTNRVGTENMHNASKGLRDGNSAAYVYDPYNDDWNESIMDAQVTQLIKADLGLTAKNGKLVMETDAAIQYWLSDIHITSKNAMFAGDNGKTLTFETTATVEVPFYVMGKVVTSIRLERTAETTFMNKF